MKENHKRVQSIFAARFRAPTKWGQNGDGPSCFVFWATEPYGGDKMGTVLVVLYSGVGTKWGRS